MTNKTIPLKISKEEEFQAGLVLPVAFSHFIQDIYTATLAPLLPVIIDKLSISLTAAGSLTAILQLPAIINPFIGYIADKISLRYLVIFAPAVTATLISCLSFADSYWVMALLLFVTGISVACYHAPAPALMAVSIWTLEGFYRIVILGWGTSIFLFIRLRNSPTAMGIPPSIRTILPTLRTLFVPLALINLFRNFMLESVTTYLPIYMDSQGASLAVAGGALSILELAGVIGAITSGTISDRLGRRVILLISIISSAVIMFIFLNTSGWLLIPILLLLGFTALSTGPVMLAMVQDHLPDNRSLGNSLLMLITFLVRPIAILAIGIISDHFGLRTSFMTGAIISLFAIPAILTLPRDKEKQLN